MAEKKISRRRWLEVAGGTVAGLAVGASAGYFSALTPAPIKPAETITKTVTHTVTPAPTLTPPKPEKEKIVIGMTYSSSGPYAYGATRVLRAAKLWLKDVNERGGIYLEGYGKKLPVEIIYYDDRSDRELVVTLYEKLIKEDKVDLLIAPFSSTLTFAVAPLTEANKIFMEITSGSMDKIYEQGWKYISSGSQQIASRVSLWPIEYAMDVIGVKRVALACADISYPLIQTEATAKMIEEKGGEVVVFEKYPLECKDFTPILEKIRSAKPDYINVFSFLDDQILLFRQLVEAKVWAPLVFFNYSTMPEWDEALGKDGLYVLGCGWSPAVDWPTTQGWDKKGLLMKGREMFGEDFVLEQQIVFHYATMTILERVIEGSGDLDPAKLKESAVSLTGKMYTIVGPYEVDERGAQLLCGQPVSQVQLSEEGENIDVLLWPPECGEVGEVVYPFPKWEERE